jgi:hypothetical protein
MTVSSLWRYFVWQVEDMSILEETETFAVVASIIGALS